MIRYVPVFLVALAVAGCASSRTVPLETVTSGPYLRAAADAERRLERQNKNEFECEVEPDTLIVCDGVHQRIR